MGLFNWLANLFGEERTGKDENNQECKLGCEKILKEFEENNNSALNENELTTYTLLEAERNIAIEEESVMHEIINEVPLVNIMANPPLIDNMSNNEPIPAMEIMSLSQAPADNSSLLERFNFHMGDFNPFMKNDNFSTAQYDKPKSSQSCRLPTPQATTPNPALDPVITYNQSPFQPFAEPQSELIEYLPELIEHFSSLTSESVTQNDYEPIINHPQILEVKPSSANKTFKLLPISNELNNNDVEIIFITMGSEGDEFGAIVRYDYVINDSDHSIANALDNLNKNNDTPSIIFKITA